MKESILPPSSTHGRVQGLTMIAGVIAGTLANVINKELNIRRNNSAMPVELGQYMFSSFGDKTSINDVSIS